MKAKHVLCSLGLLASGLIVASGAKGLSYQDNVDVEFTFEPTLSIGLSAQVLKIDNLAPGSSGESNEITVTVNSNNVTGYTLSANVGSSTNTSSDLTFDADNAFECLAVGSSVALADFADSTWGYTIDSGTNYSGLADYASGNSTVLKKTISSGDTNTAFKIAAKASGDQIAGNYTNKVNFTVVTNYVPVSGNMQEVTSADLALLMPDEGDVAVLKDMRDNKQYRVTKLADGNYWMTQNLDFDIVAGTTYTNENTDIGWNSGTGSYDSASWTPSTSTYATGVTTWNSSTTSPESYDPGNLCWNGVLDENWETTLDNGTTACIDGSNMNYSIGNYYNWTAAVAMNDSSSYTTQNTDVNQSICPAGWMLPKSGTVQTGSGSFLYLKDQLSLTSGTSGNIQNSPVYFTYGGDWEGESYVVGALGGYWSSVVDGESLSYNLYFGADGYLDPQCGNDRNYGYSVRCLAR